MSNEENAPGERPSLSDAAAALDGELRRFEELVAAAGRIPLSSQKNLDRAARSLVDAAAAQETVGARLRVLVEAITAARAKQEATAAVILARGHEVRARAEAFMALRERFDALGRQAAEVNALLAEAGASKSNGAAAGLAARLEGIDAHIGEAVDAARAIARDAGQAGMVDLEREADAMRQQLQAVRNKLGLLRQRSGGGPVA
jgi:chromosome segregation ATPase